MSYLTLIYIFIFMMIILPYKTNTESIYIRKLEDNPPPLKPIINKEELENTVDNSREAINNMIKENRNLQNQKRDNLVHQIDRSSKEDLKSIYPPGISVSNHCYIPKGRNSCAPQFIIAGSMKCGTTSMHKYLQNHPQILSLKYDALLNGKGILANKEIRFFNDPLFTTMISRIGLEASLNQYYDLFRFMNPNDTLPMISGDATPMYVCTEGAGKRAKLALPEAKVIIMVREPIDRIYSEFWFKQSLGSVSPISDVNSALQYFSDCVRSEIKIHEACGIYELSSSLSSFGIHNYNECVKTLNNQIFRGCNTPELSGMCPSKDNRYCTTNSVRNSFYASQILEWIEMYGDNLLVIKSEDFYTNTSNVMNEVIEFLDLEPIDWEPITKKAYNIVNTKHSKGLSIGGSSSENTSDYPELPEEIRNQFKPFFNPLNNALSKILDKPKFW